MKALLNNSFFLCRYIMTEESIRVDLWFLEMALYLYQLLVVLLGLLIGEETAVVKLMDEVIYVGYFISLIEACICIDFYLQ